MVFVLIAEGWEDVEKITVVITTTFRALNAAELVDILDDYSN
jgi:hypothetical protein